MKINWEEIPEPLWPFVAHGVEFSSMSSDQWCGTCPWDEKPDKFYVNPKTGQWDHKMTGERGNVITFLGAAAEFYKAQMTPKLLRKLSKDRGLPVEAFKGLDLGWDGKNYMLPVYGPKGTVRDIRRWSPKIRRVMSTKGCKTQLYGLDRLAKAKSGSVVWICEGEWDRVAMRWFLRALGRKRDIVVSVPGATTFKEEWVKFFQGHDVIDVHDNDEAGDKGATRVREIFFKAGQKLRYLNWPDHWQDGWDVRDYVSYALDQKVPLRTSWKKFESLISDVHRRDKGEDQYSAVEKAERIRYLSDEEAPTFEELVKKYSRFLHMDEEMVLALKFILSIIYSQQIGTREPLWAYLVAAAGAGKTALLSATAGCARTVFRSTVTPNALVSGFKSEHDPSLLPKLSGKTFIIKDFTTTLVGAEFDFERVMAILRDAFDGDYSQGYGNNVTRAYTNLHFSMVAGVTPAIHAKPMAMMGERFLKFCMRTGNAKTRMERLMATVRSADQDSRMQKDLQDVTERFLSRRVVEEDVPPPDSGSEFVKRVAALSQILSGLRAQVTRDRYDKEILTHRPEPEVGTRPFKQFMKLARALRIVLRKKRYDDEIYSLIERIAMDSCTGFNIEIVSCLMENGNAMTKADVAHAISLSNSTVERALKDLEVLRVVKRRQSQASGEAGRPASKWSVRGEMAHCWAVAQPGRPLGRMHAVKIKERAKIKFRRRS